MATNAARHDKLSRIFHEVFLNYQAHKDWTDNVDHDFIDCVEAAMKSYDQQKSKEEWLRIGVMLGAVYEQWRQQHANGQ